MGVDAEMAVRVKRLMSDDEIRTLRWRLGESFYTDKFLILKKKPGEAPIDGSTEWDRNRHCLERVSEHFGVTAGDGETLLAVSLMGSYYGLGYERGDLPFLLSLARFLRDYTGGVVYYGGDSGYEIHELTDAVERDLWEHFVKVGHTSYCHDFGGEGMARPHCAFCNVSMRFYGSGRKGMFAAAICAGCGADIETVDGGDTWTERKRS